MQQKGTPKMKLKLLMTSAALALTMNAGAMAPPVCAMAPAFIVRANAALVIKSLSFILGVPFCCIGRGCCSRACRAVRRPAYASQVRRDAAAKPLLLHPGAPGMRTVSYTHLR